MTVLETRPADVGAARSIPTFYRMLLRGQLTRGRLVGLGVLSGISILLGVVARSADQVERTAIDVLAEYSISFVIPLAALIMATPMLANLIEDRLLVYLWLKPIPRWHLAVAAYAAVVTTLLPVVVVPIALSALGTGVSGLVLPAIGAAALGVLAYSAMYLFFGVRFSWGLWLGLLYLVLWENVLARLSDGMARVSVRSYLVSILQKGTDLPISLADRATWAAIVVPLAVAVVGVALTARALMTKDVA